MAGSPPFIISAIFACVLGANAAEPFDGNWSFHPERSDIHQGLRITFEMRGRALRFSSGGVEYTALFDGEDYPIQGASGRATVALRRLDERTIERVFKSDGKVASTATLRVADDGSRLVVRRQRHGAGASDAIVLNTYERISGKEAADPFSSLWERHFMKYLGDGAGIISYRTSGDGSLVFSGGSVTYRARPDGNDHPVTGSIIADSIMLKQIDSRTTEETWKAQGNVVVVIRRSVSADGSIMTAWTSEVDGTGPAIRNVFVYGRAPDRVH